ncbi:hypothetical protein JCM8097_000166 [Rhodosporidiobolus ruineniae]
MSFDFAAFRDNIAKKNEELLTGLDIQLPAGGVVPEAATPKKKTPVKKPSTPKTPRPDTPTTAEALVAEREKAGLRSSPRVRNSLLGLTPKKEGKRKALSDDNDEADDGERVSVNIRKYDPKRFGHIPGIKIGARFDLRIDASTASVHAPTVAGISGNNEAGCWSICVSGGYDGDVDLGERLTFSGSGGRDLKGTPGKEKNLRTAAQSFDQTWDNPLNAALFRSVQTKKPIRVMRGHKGKSCYAPVDGYRYDGLYVAAKAWQDTSDEGLKICRIALVRLPGQPPIPVQKGREAEAGDAASAAALDESSSTSTSRSNSEEGESTPATSPEPAATPKSKRSAASPKKRAVAADGPATPAKRSRRSLA